MQNVDVAIVGGGIVGLTLAIALKDAPISIAVINNGALTRDLGPQPSARVSAINQANIDALRSFGAWDSVQCDRANAYQHMHVWDKDSFGDIRFDAVEMGIGSLGVIVENQALVNALAETVINQANVHVVNGEIERMLASPQQTLLMLGGTAPGDEALSCRLLVGADGANSYVRKQADFPLTFKDYEHTAIVANIRTEKPHNNVARQAFTPTGPLALLPMADQHVCSIVWSQKTEQANQLNRLDDHGFTNALSVAANSVLGTVSLETERASFPLTMRYARQWAKEGTVIIGDAAHTIHPLAGQGANLGMQDALVLAATLNALLNDQKDIGAYKNLRAFERARKTEAVKMIAAMEGFATLFDGNNPVKKFARSAGLVAADKLTPIKHHFVKQAMGL